MNEGVGLKEKWGYVSHTPGSDLHLTINTTRGGVPAAEPDVTLMLAYLKSYSHMGQVLIRCVGYSHMGQMIRSGGYSHMGQMLIRCGGYR